MAADTPRFCFANVNDFLETKDSKCPSRDTILKDNKKEIYYRTYLDLIASTKEVEKEDFSSSLSESAIERQQSKPTKEEGEEECIWSNKELRTLRKCFQRLKLHNIALAGKVDCLEKELIDCKNSQSSTNVTLSSLKEKWSELKKRYKRVKISCKSMKEDLIVYHAALKTAGEEIKNLKNERSLLLKEFKEVTTKLDLETIRNKGLETKLEEKDRQTMEALQHCAFVTKQQCKLDEALLRKEIFQLKEELRKEQQENRLNKKALENLRNHFASVKLNGYNGIGSDNLLSAAEIDFT